MWTLWAPWTMRTLWTLRASWTLWALRCAKLWTVWLNNAFGTIYTRTVWPVRNGMWTTGICTLWSLRTMRTLLSPLPI